MDVCEQPSPLGGSGIFAKRDFWPGDEARGLPQGTVRLESLLSESAVCHAKAVNDPAKESGEPLEFFKGLLRLTC